MYYNINAFKKRYKQIKNAFYYLFSKKENVPPQIHCPDPCHFFYAKNLIDRLKTLPAYRKLTKFPLD